MSRTSGLSRTRLERMSEVMRGYVERGEVAGVVTLLCRHDKVYVKALGAQDRDTGAPMRRDTLFRIASMTKPITAVAAMILVEETKLRLDEPIDRWLPEMANRKVLRTPDGPLDDTVPAQRPITLRDLLTLRFGMGWAEGFPFRRYPLLDAMAEAGIGIGPEPPALEPDELVKRFGQLPLMHQPGERWMYHSAFDLLPALISRAAGMRFEDFLRKRIFEPLGMKDTSFTVPKSKLHRLASCYSVDSKSGKLVPYDGKGGSPKASVFPGGGSGLASTVDDYLAFGKMMLNGGRHGTQRILSRPTLELMTADQVTPEQKKLSAFFPGFWETRGWGLGVSMVTRREDISSVPGRYGWDGGFGTSWSSDPREDLVGILMIQRFGPPSAAGIYGDFWTLAYQAIDD